MITLGCAQPEPGVDFRDARLAVVDMHLHQGEWQGVPGSTQEFLASRFPFPFNLNPEQTASGILSAEGVVAELDAAGISRGVLLAVYAPRSVGVATNEDMVEQVAVAPDRLWGLASLRVDDWSAGGEAQLAQLDEMVQAPGVVGVKLAHTHMHFRMDDPRYFGIYEVAGLRQKPVYLHTGPSPFPGTNAEPPYTDPAFLEAAIAAYPETIFILGHVGYDFINKQLGYFETCVTLAQKYPNVYLEPSALGSEGSDPTGEHLPHIMGRIREAGLVERTIYGSDGPQSPGFVGDYLARTTAAMESTGYTVEEARAVLSGNFARVFQVEEPTL
ncbi:MAG: amidohydrolase [Myxococcales bacterium]|nr:amidohydrolase [Myxococcales bacterium]MCB9755201.1 amidohydrolase [Myxococcales bacterium]